jgi:hypothetical protein
MENVACTLERQKGHKQAARDSSGTLETAHELGTPVGLSKHTEYMASRAEPSSYRHKSKSATHEEQEQWNR